MGIINNNLGKAFPPAMVFAGFVLIAFGIYIISQGSWLGILIVLPGGFIALTNTGIMIDPANNRYKGYTTIFWIKTGSWKSLDDFPDMTVLRSNISTTAFSMGNRPSTTSKETYYDICLLTDSHLRKLLIKRCRDFETAKVEITKLAETLGKRKTNYNPLISSSSRAKRR